MTWQILWCVPLSISFRILAMIHDGEMMWLPFDQSIVSTVSCCFGCAKACNDTVKKENNAKTTHTHTFFPVAALTKNSCPLHE